MNTVRILLIVLVVNESLFFFFFSSRRRHTRCSRDWSSDVCSSDLGPFGINHLVSCLRDSRTKARDAPKDLVCALDPAEWPRVLVPASDPLHDVCLQDRKSVV